MQLAMQTCFAADVTGNRDWLSFLHEPGDLDDLFLFQLKDLIVVGIFPKRDLPWRLEL